MWQIIHRTNAGDTGDPAMDAYVKVIFDTHYTARDSAEAAKL